MSSMEYEEVHTCVRFPVLHCLACGDKIRHVGYRTGSDLHLYRCFKCGILYDVSMRESYLGEGVQKHLYTFEWKEQSTEQ